MPVTRRLSRALVAALLATGLTGAAAPPAAAADVPGLTIDVAEACGWLRRGDAQPMAFTVENTGSTPLDGVSVVPVTLPDGVTATVTPASTTIPAGWEVTFRATLTVAAGAPLGGQPVRFEARQGDDATAYQWTASVVDRPVPPTTVAATPGDGTATVTWSPAAANAYTGSSVSRYTVTASPGGSTAEVAGNATSATVAGLANGTAHTFTVTATTLWGTSDPSAPSEAVTPAAEAFTALPGAPGAFTGLATLTADDQKVYVALTGDVPDGATGYDVELLPAGEVAHYGTEVTGAMFPALLTNGTAHTVRVRATNATGAGPWSAQSAAAVPAGTPFEPYFRAVAGDGSAYVCFAGAGGNGSPVTEYVVTDQHDGSWSFGPAARSGWITGLANTQDYDLALHAVNALGAGDAATEPGVTSPGGGTPPAVTGVTATAGNGTATVSWDLPDGGTPWSYEVRATPGGASVVAGGATTAQVTGLANGTAYTFTVRGVGAYGSGPLSAPSAAVTPAGVPGQVSGVTAVADPADSSRALVSWQPAAANGSPVTGYTVHRYFGDPVATAPGDATSVSIAGLALNTAHGFTVTATNAAGTGQPSAVTGDVVLTAPDTTAPAVPSLTALSAFTKAASTKVGYYVPGAASYDVRYRVARYDTTFGGYRYPAAWQGRTTATASLAVVKGWTYCLSARARDLAGNVSGWSAERCTSSLLDDRSLTAGRGWTRGLSSRRYYEGTYTASTTPGAVLTGPSVRARRLAVLVTVCTGCAKLGVYLDGVLVRTINANGPGTAYQVLSTVDLGRVRTGRLTVRQLTSGRAYVDGFGATRV